MRSIALAVVAALAAAMAAAIVQKAAAQSWPSRPVTMIVPFAAGGPIDTVARILSPGLTQELGQQMVVEDIGGAGGMTGDARLARSDPDGYTFGFGNQATHIFSQYIYKKPLYDPFKDFAPIGLVVSNSKVLVVRKDLPVNNLQEFIAYARKNQDKMQYGSAGGGSATQIACVLLNDKIGAPRVTHVPYRGTALAMQDLIAGRIDYLCDITSTSQPHVQSGQIIPLAVLAKTRSEAMPNVPTALEQGLADVDSDGWNAFFAPAHTPAAIIQKINAATGKTLDDPAVAKRLAGLGLAVPAKNERSPEFLTKLIKDEMVKWAPVMKAAGVMAK
jgi:tripartite-type tricarboxylate transporter receptor subunit TctC